MSELYRRARELDVDARHRYEIVLYDKGEFGHQLEVVFWDGGSHLSVSWHRSDITAVLRARAPQEDGFWHIEPGLMLRADGPRIGVMPGPDSCTLLLSGLAIKLGDMVSQIVEEMQNAARLSLACSGESHVITNGPETGEARAT